MDKNTPYRVTLNEEAGDKFTLVFDCMAEDADDAAEQAEKAYPGCNVLNCTAFEGDLPLNSWLRNLQPASQVWWNDPDHHKSSGYYTIDFINGDEVAFNDTIIMLKNAAGSQAEVFAHELSPTQPEDLYPVVDGDCGNGDIYGYATSKEEAIEVGNETFVDPVGDAYLAENVTLSDGSKVDKAWVALTRKNEQVRLRLSLDIRVDLNGTSQSIMEENLRTLVQHGIANGFLTGNTTAELVEHALAVTEYPETTEEEIAEFMLQRIEDGDLELGDIPSRLARYGIMCPASFVLEMRERMETTEEGRG